MEVSPPTRVIVYQLFRRADRWSLFRRRLYRGHVLRLSLLRQDSRLVDWRSRRKLLFLRRRQDWKLRRFLYSFLFGFLLMLFAFGRLRLRFRFRFWTRRR